MGERSEPPPAPPRPTRSVPPLLRLRPSLPGAGPAMVSQANMVPFERKALATASADSVTWRRDRLFRLRRLCAILKLARSEMKLYVSRHL
jgi:hypothetical protein